MAPIAVFFPEQPVIHAGRRATFLHMSSRGGAIIRYWGDSHAVSVPPEALAPPPTKRRVLPASDEPISRERASQ
jgi:hypothetical protein